MLSEQAIVSILNFVALKYVAALERKPSLSWHDEQLILFYGKDTFFF